MPARPIPHGSPVAGYVPAPPRLPLLRWSPVSMHADAITPAEPRGARVVHFPRGGWPSRSMGSVGFRVFPFEACSAFTARFGLHRRQVAKQPSAPKTPAGSSPPPPLRLLTGQERPQPDGIHTRKTTNAFARRTQIFKERRFAPKPSEPGPRHWRVSHPKMYQPYIYLSSQLLQIVCPLPATYHR